MLIQIIIWIVLGLVAGMIAKFIMPGKQGGGFILTTVLGIIGAIVGGFIAQFIPFIPATAAGEFSVWSVITAVVGALIVLVIYGLVFGKKR